MRFTFLAAILALNGTNAFWPFAKDEQELLFSEKWVTQMNKMGKEIDPSIFKTEIERALKQRRNFNVEGTYDKF
jgi:hypothetical protein